ncbi:hypothetical protein QOZ80_8BG0645010 [Eleusine coracana subsp. coracana]|nr:hypothetical protein QOZ80_8BG0645010 [Eleusine coracana subsp. coracana]
MSAVSDSSGCSTDNSEKKTSWPEVVGMLVEEAEKIIKRDMPEANIVVLASGSPVTLDLRSDRIRIFVDTVTEPPRAELDHAGGKSSWPEVVGMSVKEAKEVILKEMPDAKIEVLTPGEGMTKDFQPNRVRILIDTVAETPVVG